jgi:hypothetical protein
MAALPLIRDVKPTPRVGTRRAPARSPMLTVVPRRRRWPAVIIGALWFVVVTGLLGAAVFHTQLAERQLRIDRLERQVTAERERFDELRHERAVLQSPVRLAESATELGMRRGDSTAFLAVAPDLYARQLAAAGVLDDRTSRITIPTDPLEQHRQVKVVSEGLR